MWSFIHSLVSPKYFFHVTRTLTPWLIGLFFITLSYGLIGGLVLAPADALQGDGFRIIYIHVPCAFLSLGIYAVMAMAAITSLVWRLKLGALILRHSVPLGTMFTLLALITGSLWGKPMWGTFWIWDARLTSELILLFLYLGILLFQSALVDKPSGERAVAILVLVGFIDIPIIHYSVYWWNTLHQGATLTLFSPPTIATPMLAPLLAMIAAFFIYYVLLLCLRLRYELIATQGNQHWLQEPTC